MWVWVLVVVVVFVVVMMEEEEEEVEQEKLEAVAAREAVVMVIEWAVCGWSLCMNFRRRARLSVSLSRTIGSFYRHSVN